MNTMVSAATVTATAIAYTFSKPAYELTLNFQKTKEPSAFGVSTPVDGGFRRAPFTFTFSPESPIEIPVDFIEDALLELVRQDARLSLAESADYLPASLTDLIAAALESNRGVRKYSKDWLIANARGFGTWLESRVKNKATIPVMVDLLAKNFTKADIRLLLKQIDVILAGFTAYLESLGEAATPEQLAFLSEAIAKVEVEKTPKEIGEISIDI